VSSVLAIQPDKPQGNTTSQHGTTPDPNPHRITQSSIPVIVIDVESETRETPGRNIAQVSGPSHAECRGYVLQFPPGKTPYSAYPFALHDSCSLPWDFSIENGVMTLFAHNCHDSRVGLVCHVHPVCICLKIKASRGLSTACRMEFTRTHHIHITLLAAFRKSFINNQIGSCFCNYVD
jgi:hypothetical protein